MKISEYRREIQKTLKSLFGDEAAPLCDVMLSNFLDIDFSGLILKSDEQVTEQLKQNVAAAIDELGYGVPIQYILGSCWFYGMKIIVGKGCFIPRSDTENLVKAAIASIPQNGTFVDICSGSGCITAAVCKSRTDVRGYALEYSQKALPFTEKNTEDFNNATVCRFDAMDSDDYISVCEQNGGFFDAVLCNPPYIKTLDIDFLQQQVLFEPHNALDGGDDGLLFYREITRFLPLILKEDGVVFFEIGIDQSREVCAILNDGGFQTATIKDINGIERVVLGKKY
ncbi:MAG: peptide chain release factor N(5)-glutamine methyltransferase [Clostridia bacterium]